jgi:hypothetical protein
MLVTNKPGLVGALPPMRRLALTMGSTAYVAAAAVYAAEGRGLRTWAMVIASLVVAFSAAGRQALAPRLATWGLAIVIASLAASGAHGWLNAFGAVGAMACALAARYAIAHVVSAPGLAAKPARSPYTGLFTITVAWLLPLVATMLSFGQGRARIEAAQHAREWATLAAGFTVVLLLVTGAWVERRRRLEMGVTTRIAASMALTATVALLSCAGAALRLDEPENVGRLAVGVSSVLIVWIALHGDGVAIAKSARRALVLSLVGGSVAMMGAAIAEGRPQDGAVVALVAAIAALLVGAAAKVIEEPMRPMRGLWLDATKKAQEELSHADPDEAIRLALVTLRAPAGVTAASPELWTLAPTRVATVDAAGYLREKPAELVEGLIATAASEPEAALRTEVLDALVVRRPELRGMARWLDLRGAMSATIVTRSGEPEGLLVLPRGNRFEPLTLEEARAIKRLADALAAVCHSRAIEQRARERERELILRADHAEEAGERLRHDLALHVGRHALAAARLARPATVGVYSAPSRLALEALERRTIVGAPIAVVAPSGVDPVAYIARAHLAGPRAAGPLVLVDCTSAREHDVGRWSDEKRSPLALADRGMLVLLDGAALPLDVQRLVARSLAERRPPWERAEPLDVALAFTATQSPAALVEAARLDDTLATRLGDARETPIEMPRLRDRPEDIRAVVTDRLAREGLRVKGTPVGIEAAAFARLVDHPFHGEEAELASLVQRLVATCAGDVVRVADVEALGFGARRPPDEGIARELAPPSKKAKNRKNAL